MANFRKKYAKKAPKKAVRGRRRLFASPIAVAGGVAVVKTAKAGYNYRTRQGKIASRTASALLQNRLESSDNIITNKTVYIGKPRKLSFQEKIARSIRGPMLFKRNYQWNVECDSGRKAWFHMDFNVMNNSDLQLDITTHKVALSTNTQTNEGTVDTAFNWDQSKFYIDSLRENIRMVNSSSNSIKGKCYLIAYKRDTDNNYGGTGTPVSPVNMSAYLSTFGGLSVTGAGSLANTVGNGWKFDTATAGSRYDSPYHMPGSSLHPTAVSLQTDPQFDLFSPHIKDSMNFYFRVVNTTEFSLKAGQQFDQKIVMNDLRKIHREQQEFIHLQGITYTLVVSFTGGIVGDAGLGAGVGLVTSGSVQLSCIRESTRTLGIVNPIRSQVLLQTAPMATIPLNVQVAINQDSGTLLTSAQYDP